MKKLFMFGALICTIGMFAACSNDKKTSSRTKFQNSPIIYNDSIQSHFFGLSFGASPQEVNTKLKSIGLYTTDKLISNGRQSYKAGYPQNHFSFGGYSWTWFNSYFSNNQLYAIEFMSPFKTKEGAASLYNNVVSSLSEKYNMQPEQPSDTMVYGRQIGWTQDNNKCVGVYYERYESVGHEMWYGTCLFYYDLYYNQENNEL